MLRSFALIAIFGGSLGAQEFRSTITGRITDPSAAAVPNATVVLLKLIPAPDTKRCRVRKVFIPFHSFCLELIN
jgi:hypothetical protein